MANQRVRDYAKSLGVPLWRIADRFGITDAAFSRKLRREFDEETAEKMLKMVREIAEESPSTVCGISRRRSVANKKIRDYARCLNVPLWMVADHFGITDNTFSRKLRHEFSEEMTENVLKAIREIANAEGKCE